MYKITYNFNTLTDTLPTCANEVGHKPKKLDGSFEVVAGLNTGLSGLIKLHVPRYVVGSSWVPLELLVGDKTLRFKRTIVLNDKI